MLAAAQVRTPVGCDAAGAHGVLRTRVDRAGVSAIRIGDVVGGKARAANLTPKRRREIARKAAARWGKGKENKL
jgi:hypothetical protein